ncbi:unnamed protein product [Symbiodinium natans]|uniref:Uncharacterized protein n=1 Tax=Symbiodinium natans TaxID=878477 RepID=A0A812U8S1_9DINO|nr:unnamed protein product [Symbiodinium natans]
MQAPRRLRPWRGNADAVASFLALPGDQPEDSHADRASRSSTSASCLDQNRDVPGVLLSSASVALLAPALPVGGFSSQIPLQVSGYMPLGMAEEADPASEALVPEADGPGGPGLAIRRGDKGPAHAEHYEHQQTEEPPEQHGSDDMMMADIGLAMVSSGLTIMLAMMGAVCALRICREMLRRRNASAEGTTMQTGTPAPDGSLQAFRPFAGQGYRLVVEGDVSKPPTPRTSPSDPVVGEDKRSADRRFPGEAGLPNFGAGLASPDA